MDEKDVKEIEVVTIWLRSDKQAKVAIDTDFIVNSQGREILIDLLKSLIEDLEGEEKEGAQA